MHQPSIYSNSKTAERTGLTQRLKAIITRIKSFTIASLCLEKCRFCSRELALAGTAAVTNPQSLYTKHDDTAREAKGDLSPQTVSGILRILDLTDSIEKIQSTADCAPPVIPIETGKRFGNELWSKLIKPLKLVANELDELTLSATHAKLVPPALIYFAKHPLVSPRLSECLCSLCWDEIEVDLPLLGFFPLTGVSQQTLPIASGVSYEGKIKELIRSFKYEGDAVLAADLASVMSIGWSALTDHMPASRVILVPVPLHNSRKRLRGYNQSELLAKELSSIMAVPVVKEALKRQIPTRTQQALGRAERLENVRDAFVGKSKILQDKTVVLIDDVCTSGATLAACAEAALKGGATSVVALTVARALLWQDL
jgi:ComF family protein